MRDGHEYFNGIKAIRSFWLAGSGEELDLYVGPPLHARDI